jgi:RNA polymerase sigma-70 factor (ECF subfamily)
MEYECFPALVAPHTLAMARVATALVGAGEAEDAAQEALMRAWRGWPGLREPVTVRGWLLKITVNVCHTWRRGTYGTRQRTTESLDAASMDVLSRLATPGIGTSAHADALDLHSALAALSEEHRQVVALRFLVGMDATEIGALLDAPPATIRTRLRRALTLLREALRMDESGDVADTTVSTGPHARGGK